jgi:hypothetical protein
MAVFLSIDANWQMVHPKTPPTRAFTAHHCLAEASRYPRRECSQAACDWSCYQTHSRLMEVSVGKVLEKLDLHHTVFKMLCFGSGGSRPMLFVISMGNSPWIWKFLL